MNNQSPIVEHLFSFTQVIINLEKELSILFNLSDTPYNVSRSQLNGHGNFIFKGLVAEYKFHGGGCLFTYNGRFYDYDILSPEPHIIKISPWKFIRYLNSVIPDQFSEEQIALEFSNLSEQGYLLRLPHGTGSYQVNLQKLNIHL